MGSGVVGGYTENTLQSFLAAVEAGTDWVEVDVRRTPDGRLVVAHDPEDEDGRADVATESHDVGRSGTLLLDELLEALPAHVGIDFDLKSSMEDALLPHRDATVGVLAPVAERESRRRPVAVVSFDPAAILALRELAPGVATGWTTWVSFPLEHAVAAAAHLDVQFLGLHKWSALTRGPDKVIATSRLAAALDHLHGCKRQLLVWCPGSGTLPSVVETGVDAVCVNDVSAALATLGR